MKRFFFRGLVLSLLLAAGCHSGKTVLDNFPPGLYIENGLFMKDGLPYYGVGTNYFDMFTRAVEQDDLSGLDGMMDLKRAGVPFIRFSASCYGPDSWKATYLNDKEAYFETLDQFVAKAEKLNIGLIPSLFWHIPTFPDICSEHMDQYANPDSKTIDFIRQYTDEVVSRYKDSPAIWGWEFGNEYSLQIDIPHGYVPDLLPGSPFETRDPVRDQLSQQGMLLAFSVFSETVRNHDSTRPVFSGNDSPRGSAYHNTHNGPEDDWQPDNEEEYKIMIDTYESNVNTITTRGYYNYGENARNYPLGKKDFSDFVGWLVAYSKTVGKPVFVGEFGGLPQWQEENKNWIRYENLKEAWAERFDAVVENNIQLSAIWNYDYYYSAPEDKLTIDNDKLGIFKMMKEANEILNDK